ncbi:hypothetical protein [Hymenobacter guriensis]|uniref:DUF5610 domain-containing protein n=1 Tax=Hymenobacter guriensis TaxID=2793065 RepID=A0ABS0L4Z0_9BACT|nr:hypothetical protein [Hymenobacter guriensis]MBG8555000.1 hypothetical protein [Hymenobacter guriensis]
MQPDSEHDDNYFRGSIDGGSANLPADAPVIDGGGPANSSHTRIISGGNASTRHMENSKLAKADGFDFPKGLPTSVKLHLHTLADQFGVTTDNLAEKAHELAAEIKPKLEEGYDFVVNYVENLIEQVKTDVSKYLDSKKAQ